MAAYQATVCPYYLTRCLNIAFFMNRLMAENLSSADFIIIDVLYTDVSDFPYLLNVTAFDFVTLVFMVVGRANMDRTTTEAYSKALDVLFRQCTEFFPPFDNGQILSGIIVDYSDAQAEGIEETLGEERRMRQ